MSAEGRALQHRIRAECARRLMARAEAIFEDESWAADRCERLAGLRPTGDMGLLTRFWGEEMLVSMTRETALQRLVKRP